MTKAKRAIENAQPAGTREKLLKAALQLFAKHGYDGTSTKQICDAAGANVAAVTYHFESKENLLKSIFSEHLDRDFSMISLILKEVHSIDELKLRVRMYCEAMLETINRESDFHHLVAREASVNPVAFEVMKKGVDNFRLLLNTFFKNAKKRGLISKDVDESLIGYALFALLVGFRLDGVAKKLEPQFDFSDTKKRQHYIDRVLNMLFHGIVSSED